MLTKCQRQHSCSVAFSYSASIGCQYHFALACLSRGWGGGRVIKVLDKPSNVTQGQTQWPGRPITMLSSWYQLKEQGLGVSTSVYHLDWSRTGPVAKCHQVPVNVCRNALYAHQLATTFSARGSPAAERQTRPALV